MEFDLDRFIQAQHYSYESALAEIRRGLKTSHWMWYIFPQLKGLGRSDTAIYYGLSGLAEAKAYFADPVLGSRLVEITRVLLEHTDKTPVQIFGHTDAMKLRSCMTLFAQAAPEEPVFQMVLDNFYNGKPDYRTLGMLRGKP